MAKSFTASVTSGLLASITKGMGVNKTDGRKERIVNTTDYRWRRTVTKRSKPSDRGSN